MATNGGSGAGRQLPKQFGRYLVRKQLGDGGMGSVYLVLNTDLQREEALKVPNFDAGAEADMRERFLREARAAAGLDHPNLCQVYDVGERDGVCYLTMRYLNGQPLSDYTGAAQPPRKAVEIVTKLAQALAVAHDKGVTHRDLKPGNVMMCPGVGPVVMDFGLAKQTQQQGRKLTRMGSILGTPAYMPPEQVKGDLTKLGPASDVYSLGVILFELLTGRLPFAAATEEEVYAAVLYTPPPPPSALRPGLPTALDSVCQKAMAKAPEDRYPSMKALAADLFAYLKATPPAPGNVDLMITKGGTGNVFQMATVTSGLSKPATAPPRSKGPTAPAPGSKATPAPPQSKGPSTQRGGKAPSSIRPAAGARKSGTQAPIIKTRVGGGNDGRRLSSGVLVCGVLCFLLIVGAVGGIGALVYVLNQKKADDSGDSNQVAAASTTTQPPPRFTPINDSAPPPPPSDKGSAPPADSDKALPPPTLPSPQPALPDKDKTPPPPPPPPPPPLPADKDKAPPALADKDKAPPPPADQDKAPPPPPVVDKEKTPPPVVVDKDKTPAPPPPDKDKAPALSDKDKAPTPAPDPKPTPVKPADPAVLFFEDFKAVKRDELPKDWDGESFTVQKDEDDRPCLEVDGHGTHYVTLPRQFIKGDFQLECEFRLSGFSPVQFQLGDHELRLELAGRSSTPLTAVVNHLGGVRLGGEYKKADEVTPFQNFRLRLTRKGDSYRVGFKVGDDDQFAGAINIPGKGCFEQIRLGLTGGKPPVTRQAPANQFAACLYWIRITSLESQVPKPDPNEPPAPVALYEDFSKVAAGALPDGWKKSKINNLGVRTTGSLPGLEVINPLKGVDGASLPLLDLKGDFYVDVTAMFPLSFNPNGSIRQVPPASCYLALFFKGPKTKELVVQMYVGGSIVVQDKPPATIDGSKYWAGNGRPNLLRVARSSKDETYHIELNDSLVGNVPLSAGPGPFTSVEVVLFVNAVGQPSPRVTGVRIVPLVPEP